MAAADVDSDIDIDAARLALLGKTQVLKRRFGLISIIAFATCELVTWETVLALFSQGYDNGGPAGLVYGFLIAWLSTLSVYMVISELASMAPLAGGQYFWVYMLAPDRYKIFCSYIIGWLTSLAWIATVATESIFTGTMIQGILIVGYPNYDAKLWQGTLLTWAVIASSVFINVVIPGFLPKLQTASMALHVAGFIAVMSVLWTFSPIGTADDVFKTSLNEGGWSSQGLSYCVGFLGNVATFVGADASVHMAEEISNAAVNIPRAICGSMIFNGLIGFAMMLTALFCLGDPTTVLESKTAFPFIQLFVDSTPSITGATVLIVIVLVMTWTASIGITTTASRMTWSFARDRGTPFSLIVSRVERRTRVPAIAVGVVTILSALLTLIYIGSSTAFNDVISLTITGFYGSYLLPAMFLLWRRITGQVAVPTTVLGMEGRIMAPAEAIWAETEKRAEMAPELVQDGIARAQLIWGPWRLPRVLGTINNAYACCYMVFVIFWSFWPPATPVDAKTMNYSVLVTGGVILFSIFWYWVRGRNEYKGPTIDEEVKVVMRLGSVGGR